MTDNRPIELLCKLLEERGIEWKDGDAAYEIEWSTHDGRNCSAMYWKPTFTVLISGCTPEQAIAATLGGDAKDCENLLWEFIGALDVADTTDADKKPIVSDYARHIVATLGNGTLTAEQVSLHLKAMALDLQSPNPFKPLEEKQAIIEKYAQEIAELWSGTCETEARS